MSPGVQGGCSPLSLLLLGITLLLLGPSRNEPQWAPELLALAPLEQRTQGMEEAWGEVGWQDV